MIVRGRVQSNDDDHRVTTFELFFDLVFVFAFTQLTSYMAHNHTAAGIVQAMLLLALFWWSWSAYAWLGNQANAGVGTVRAVMVVAMTAVFILAAVALVASWPLLAATRPLVGMAIVLAVLVALVGVEVRGRERVFSTRISPPHEARRREQGPGPPASAPRGR